MGTLRDQIPLMIHNRKDSKDRPALAMLKVKGL